jgi:hypothetical protein
MPRRFLATTAAIEIAARTRIAIRIGTKGEEPPSSSDVVGAASTEPFPGPAGFLPSAEPLPEWPWLEPPSPPGLPPCPEDAPPPGDPPEPPWFTTPDPEAWASEFSDELFLD